MIVSTNPLIVACERKGCDRQLTLKASSTGDMADELLENGWGWLRNDEAYDHVCSQACRDESVMSQAKKHRASLVKNHEYWGAAEAAGLQDID